MRLLASNTASSTLSLQLLKRNWRPYKSDSGLKVFLNRHHAMPLIV